MGTAQRLHIDVGKLTNCGVLLCHTLSKDATFKREVSRLRLSQGAERLQLVMIQAVDAAQHLRLLAASNSATVSERIRMPRSGLAARSSSRLGLMPHTTSSLRSRMGLGRSGSALPLRLHGGSSLHDADQPCSLERISSGQRRGALKQARWRL